MQSECVAVSTNNLYAFAVLCVVYLVFVWQEKITKEMNYILSNQDTVLAQITQLESSITQTEVINTFSPQNLIERGINTSRLLLRGCCCSRVCLRAFWMMQAV